MNKYLSPSLLLAWHNSDEVFYIARLVLSISTNDQVSNIQLYGYLKLFFLKKHISSCCCYGLCTLYVATNKIVIAYWGCTKKRAWSLGISRDGFTSFIQKCGKTTCSCGSPCQYTGYRGIRRLHNGLSIWKYKVNKKQTEKKPNRPSLWYNWRSAFLVCDTNVNNHIK